MRAWKLTTSFDIGELAFELAKAGWVRMIGGESPVDYRGIYEVGDASWLAPSALRGRCGKCDYDLRGTPTYICPECGARND